MVAAMLPVEVGLAVSLYCAMSASSPAWLDEPVNEYATVLPLKSSTFCDRRVCRHVPVEIGRADHLAADDADRRALGEGADGGRHAGGGRDVHAAADHRLDRFRAGLDVEDFEVEPVLLEDAAALAELGDAGIPGAALGDRDLQSGLQSVLVIAAAVAPRRVASAHTAGKRTAIVVTLDDVKRSRPVQSSVSRPICSRMSSPRKRRLPWAGSDARWKKRCRSLRFRRRIRRRRSLPHSGLELRAALVQRASVALWHFVVQREACGLRGMRDVLRAYRVPAEVAVQNGRTGALTRNTR